MTELSISQTAEYKSRSQDPAIAGESPNGTGNSKKSGALKKAGRRKLIERISFFVIRAFAFLNVFILCSLIGYIGWKSLPVLNWDFLFESPKDMFQAGGVWPCIVGTLILCALSMAIALPLGCGCAVWLHEYSSNKRLKNIIRLSVANLAGVPSIVFGLFGLAFFVTACGFGVSILSCVLTLAILTMPIIINTVEEALSQVPDSLRAASYALGATKSQTIFRTVLPAAAAGILTGAILALARSAGETGVIMFTGAVISTRHLPDSVFSAVMALPYHVYTLAATGMDPDKVVPIQSGTSFILLVLVLGMNLAAILMRNKLSKNRG